VVVTVICTAVGEPVSVTCNGVTVHVNPYAVVDCEPLGPLAVVQVYFTATLGTPRGAVTLLVCAGNEPPWGTAVATGAFTVTLPVAVALKLFVSVAVTVMVYVPALA
jgi:hypothetical protein